MKWSDALGMKTIIALSGGCLLAMIAGCAYAPEGDIDMSEYDFPVCVSSNFALAPNARWTSLHYKVVGGAWSPDLHMRIFRDSHRVKFDKDNKWSTPPEIVHYDRIVTVDEWNWIVRQLELSRVSRWKTSYEPAEGVDILDAPVWGLEFLDGSNVVGKVNGYCVWPKNFKAFQAILNAFDGTSAGNGRHQ